MDHYKLEEDIMVLNNVTKFHKNLIKTIGLRERTSFQMMIFHKQRAITTESMVRYGPLRTGRRHHGTKQCDQVS